MSQVNELLNNLTDEQIAAYTANPETEPHIIIGPDRVIRVPDELKRIAVQFDHNIETVTFDCPRYWDGNDLSTMTIYINYLRPDNTPGSYKAKNVVVDGTDENVMHFDWTIEKHVTLYQGNLSILVCTKCVDENGNEKNHWNSELNKDMYISEGLEFDGESLAEKYPDIITQILTSSEFISTAVASVESMRGEVESARAAVENARTDVEAAREDVENTRVSLESRMSNIQTRLDVADENVCKISLDKDPLYSLIYETGSYFHVNGHIQPLRGYHHKRTQMIPCKEGDTFLYYGYADGTTTASWAFYDDTGSFVSSASYNALKYGEIKVVIPSGITGVVFSSCALTSNDVTLRVLGPSQVEYKRLKEASDIASQMLEKCVLTSSLLDSVAYAGKTYREIFEYGNLIPYGNFENGLTFVSGNTNNAEITDEVCYTPDHALKCFGSSSVQIRIAATLIPGHTYFNACKARVDRYVSGGGAGIYHSSGSPALLTLANNEFVTIRGSFVASSDKLDIFIGTVSAANCDAYIDDFVLVDLSALSDDVAPTVDEMAALYEQYLNIKINLDKNVQTNDHPIGVDEPAYGGKTYRSIFETSNLLEGGDFETTALLDGAVSLYGTPVITDTISCTGSKSLMCSGASSQYMTISKSLTAGEYFMAAMVKWEQRVSGYILIESPFGAVYHKVVTNDFVPILIEGSLAANRDVGIIIGMGGGGSGTAYIDDVVLIKKDAVFAGMPIPPSYALLQLYTTYIEIKRGNKTSGIRHVYRETAVNAFLNAMRKKANDIGISDIGTGLKTFTGASMSANEMLRLGLEACSYSDLCRIWNKKTYSYVTGNLRTVTLTSTVQDTAFETDYIILGGKTGSGNSGDPSFLVIVGENRFGTRYIGAVCRCINEVGVDHRWEAMKTLFDIATAYEEDPGYDLSSATVPYVTGAAICKLPFCNTALLQGRADVVFAQNADEKSTSIQSVTKVLNVCTALEWIKDLETVVKVVDDDDISESIVRVGDVLTLRELMHALMLPSSNGAGNVIARVVGEKIVNTYCDMFGVV